MNDSTSSLRAIASKCFHPLSGPVLLVLVLGALGCAPRHVASGGPLGAVVMRDERCVSAQKPMPALEVIHAPSMQVYIAAGVNPIGARQWEALERLSAPWVKNSTRNLLFTDSCFFRSPEVASDCQGAGCFQLTEVEGYTWAYMAKVRCTGCYPDSGACGRSTPVPPAGQVRVVAVEKCHELRFSGEVFELTDEWGSTYLMHASAVEDRAGWLASLERVVLPRGWSVRVRQLEAPLVLAPRVEQGRCRHTLIRDSEDNGYHQVTFSGTAQPLDAAGCG